MIKVSIVGGSGYGGGELLRLLSGHLKVTVQQVTSRRFVGKPLSLIHPNLRNVYSQNFCSLQDLKPCDLLFLALPNGVSMSQIKKFQKLAPKIIDLSADFRLHDPKVWQEYYKTPHLAPQLLPKFIYGIPEIYSDQIKKANYIAGPGCEAIVSTLSLYPFIKKKLIKTDSITIDAKMGSSQSGNSATSSSHHPERSGVVRSYKPTGHRHTAEVEQTLNQFGQNVTVNISATAIDMVRGILVTIHTFLNDGVTEKDIWLALRKVYQKAPFVRTVKQSQGLYRYPEPKILQGTNFCDIGFAKDPRSNRLVIIGAIDNLVKGTAGNAIQCLNLMFGFSETQSLEFPGLHPI